MEQHRGCRCRAQGSELFHSICCPGCTWCTGRLPSPAPPSNDRIEGLQTVPSGKAGRRREAGALVTAIQRHAPLSMFNPVGLTPPVAGLQCARSTFARQLNVPPPGVAGHGRRRRCGGAHSARRGGGGAHQVAQVLVRRLGGPGGTGSTWAQQPGWGVRGSRGTAPPWRCLLINGQPTCRRHCILTPSFNEDYMD